MKPTTWPEQEASPSQSDIHRQRTPPPTAFAKLPVQAGGQPERGVEWVEGLRCSPSAREPLEMEV